METKLTTFPERGFCRHPTKEIFEYVKSIKEISNGYKPLNFDDLGNKGLAWNIMTYWTPTLSSVKEYSADELMKLLPASVLPPTESLKEKLERMYAKGVEYTPIDVKGNTGIYNKNISTGIIKHSGLGCDTDSFWIKTESGSNQPGLIYAGSSKTFAPIHSSEETILKDYSIELFLNKAKEMFPPGTHIISTLGTKAVVKGIPRWSHNVNSIFVKDIINEERCIYDHISQKWAVITGKDPIIEEKPEYNVWRFKTEEEFKKEELWDNKNNIPFGWNLHKELNGYLGKPIPPSLVKACQLNKSFTYNSWFFNNKSYTSNPLPREMTDMAKAFSSAKGCSSIDGIWTVPSMQPIADWGVSNINTHPISEETLRKETPLEKRNIDFEPVILPVKKKQQKPLINFIT